MESLINIQNLPAPFGEKVTNYFEQYLAAAAKSQIIPLNDAELLDELPKVWAASEFISRLCIADPVILADLASSGDLLRDYETDEYQRCIALNLAETTNEANLIIKLRQLRRREMLRIAWRDLSGRANYQTTVAELSNFADTIIAATVNCLTNWLIREFGTPYSATGNVQTMIVLALGKLGAKELNFSSDIDLIFIYPEEGSTQGRRSISNSEFFIRLGQRLIKTLTSVTALGFVFRVDVRLRPFGESGPLAISFDALENYYQAHGREWERYALIRARPVTGDANLHHTLLKLLRPFIYRRYLDYGAMDALREMKELINTEVRRKGLIGNVKLGAGGIREIEFIVQVFQLTRGGRALELQNPCLLPVLDILAKLKLLSINAVSELTTAYIFLRNIEHRLQEYNDQQTQTLPNDEIANLRLALSMGYSEWSTLKADLERHFNCVHQHFQNVFAYRQNEIIPDAKFVDFQALWNGVLDNEQVIALLAELGMDSAANETLARLRNCPAVRALSDRGQERLARLMPVLLLAVSKIAQPNIALERLVIVLESIVRRTAYMALLGENPSALAQLVRLCAASSWITQQIARFPLLLDELIDPRALYNPPRRAMLADSLRQIMARIPSDDLEVEMEALRHFRHGNTLRVAAADITGVLPLMVVSDHLTELAEVILEEILEIAWHDLVKKHGRPPNLTSHPEAKRFAIIGYGKLGGIELGYGSDLDIVFIHDGAVDALTDGTHPIEVAVFFSRLAQRLVHILTAHTPTGRLYDIDLRLRPSGSSGLLVTTLESYRRYQHNSAWTWEQQALVRARPVAGDPEVWASFQQIRHEVLSKPRDSLTLHREVWEMRERMRHELGSKNQELFDIKHDRGGTADIEFLVQYLLLRHAHFYPELIKWTDNIRQLDALRDAGIISVADTSLLQDAYRYLRRVIHHLRLQGEKPYLPLAKLDKQLLEYRRAITKLWENN